MEQIPRYLSPLQARCGEQISEVAFPHEQAVLSVTREGLLPVLEFLKEDASACFDLFLDLTAVDYIQRKPRFEVVIHLVSIPLGQRLRIKVLIDEEDAQLPSITPVYPAANWFERECYDLYGIKFIGHPNLKRLLLYEGFEGYPLRKDYPVKGRQPRVELRKPEVKRSDLAGEADI